jgi:hypothetical protein
MTTPKNTETKTTKEGKPSRKLPWWVIGLGVIYTALVIYASYETSKSANELFEPKPSQEKTTSIISQKRLEQKRLELEQRLAEEEKSESLKSTAEHACRKAVKESLVTKDGYHIPLGSVKTSKLVSEPNKYVTKFPFTVKNLYGVSMEHGVECVATGEGVVTEINQLY